VRVGIGFGCVCMAVTAAIWALVKVGVVLGWNDSFPAFTEWYRGIATRYVFWLPPTAPISLTAAALVLALIGRTREQREAVGRWSFSLLLGALEFLVVAGEWCEKRRGRAEWVLLAGFVFAIVGGLGAVVLEYRHESERTQFDHWLTSVEEFLRGTTLSAQDAQAYKQIPPYRLTYEHLSSHSRSQLSAPGRLDTLLRATFASADTSARTERIRLAYLLADSLRQTAGRDSLKYLADAAGSRAWSAIALVRGKLALDRLTACNVDCPDLAGIVRDFRQVLRETHLSSEGLNGEARAIAWAVSMNLASGQGSSDSLVRTCGENLWSCVSRAMGGYERAARHAEMCERSRIRASNNQLALLAQLAAAHHALMADSARVRTLPLWARDPVRFADTLARRAEGLMTCLPRGLLTPPVFFTTAEAASARFGLLYSGKSASTQEMENLASSLRLALAMDREPEKRVRLSSLCTIDEAKNAEEVWTLVTQVLRPMPNGSLDALRERLRRECL